MKHGGFSNENTFTGALKKYIKQHHNEYDLIVMNGYSTIAEMRAIKWMVKHNVPYVLQINGGVIKKDSSWKKKMKTYFISHADKWFSPCLEADKYLLHYGADEKRIYHYPYGNYFDNEIIAKPLGADEKFELRRKYNLPGGKLFVNASQFIERKNNIQLMSAFKGRTESLLLIGTGKDKAKYERFIKDNDLTNVMLMDFQKKAELFEILKSCDYFITLSQEDIFGHTTLEAMANGLPVISSDRVVSSRDIINDGHNGYLVDIEDEICITNAIDTADRLSSEDAIATAKKNTIEQSAKTLNELLRRKE